MKVKHTLMLLGIAAVTMTSATAWADAPRYDFVDLSYQTITDPSGSGFSSDHAYGLDVSYAFTDHLIGAAQYAHESADFNGFGLGSTASGNSFEAGLGYRIALSSSVDLIPNLSYLAENSSVSVPGSVGSSNSNTGYDVGLQLRAMLTEQFELDANIDRASPGQASTTVAVAALYTFTHSFALGLGYADSTSNSQTTTGWTVAARFYFD